MENSRYTRIGRSGFTLLDTLMYMGIVFTIIIASAPVAQYVTSAGYIQTRSVDLSSELATAMFYIDRHMLGAYAMDYENTGGDGTNDKLVVYTDKQEKTKLSFFVRRDATKDISQVYYQYDGGDPVALTSDSAYILKFKVTPTPSPRGSPGRIDDPPFVRYEIQARSRSPLRKQSSDGFLASYETKTIGKVGMSLIGNFVPTSLKN